MFLALIADTLLRGLANRLLRAHVVRVLTARVIVPGVLAVDRFVYTRADARHDI